MLHFAGEVLVLSHMGVRKKSRKIAAAGKAHRREAGPRKSALLPILDPIITMNASGLIESASDSVELMFGWTPAELFGQSVTVLVPESKRSSLDRYLDRYRRSSSTQAVTRGRVFDAVRKDGKLFQIELSMSRADLPANAPPYFIGIIHSPGQEIEKNSDNDEKRTRMHRLITEQTRALASANLRLHLSDRLAALGTLASGLGHDMNSMLLPVRARLNAMEHAGISPAAMAHLTAIRRSITYLQHLSDGLHFLTIDSDKEAGPSNGQMTTNITRWWKEMGTLLRKTVPSHVKVDAKFPDILPDVNVAPYLLTQAMLNLLVNAGESIPQGRRNGKVKVWAKKTEDGKSLRLGVSDNGRGMTQQIQRRAFDLFYTTKVRSLGTGLGLPLARKVAMRAGGSMELQSTPGNGTSAALVLPIVEASRVKGGNREIRRVSAALSVHDHRTAALISQILVSAGVDLRAVRDTSPGTPDMWITQPTATSLVSAERLRKSRSKGTVVLVGSPPKNVQEKWDRIGATVIDRIDDFETIRHILGLTVSAQTSNIANGEKI